MPDRLELGELSVTLVEGPSPPRAWERLLADAEHPSLYADPVWATTLCRHLPRRRPLWLLVSEGERPLAGMIGIVRRRGPLEVVQGQHEGLSGAPLLVAGLPARRREEVVAACAVGWARLVGRGVRRVSASLSLPPPWDGALAGHLRAEGWRRETVPAAVFDLAPGLEAVEREQLRKNRRNERNRSLRRGCRLETTTDPAVAEPFLAVYALSARRWGITPPPLALLADLLAAAGGRVFCTVVRHGDEFLGGHLLLHEGETVTAWLGATLPGREELFPATLLVWGDLQEACARGARWLDLGGHGGQRGVANFKRLLGAQEVMRGLWRREWFPVRWSRAWRGRGR